MNEFNRVEYPDSTYIDHNSVTCFRTSDLMQLRLRKQNKLDLEQLRNVMEVEEGAVFTPEEVLARIITHYCRSVPIERVQVTNILQDLMGGGGHL
jgi:hypothetical protein